MFRIRPFGSTGTTSHRIHTGPPGRIYESSQVTSHQARLFSDTSISRRGLFYPLDEIHPPVAPAFDSNIAPTNLAHLGVKASINLFRHPHHLPSRASQRDSSHQAMDPSDRYAHAHMHTRVVIHTYCGAGGHTQQAQPNSSGCGRVFPFSSLTPALSRASCWFSGGPPVTTSDVVSVPSETAFTAFTRCET